MLFNEITLWSSCVLSSQSSLLEILTVLAERNAIRRNFSFGVH